MYMHVTRLILLRPREQGAWWLGVQFNLSNRCTSARAATKEGIKFGDEAVFTKWTMDSNQRNQASEVSCKSRLN